MTSNLGSDQIAEYGQQNRISETSAEISKEFKEEIETILKKHFQRDEFLGRINERVYFLPFSPQEIKQLVIKQLEALAKNAKNNHQMNVSWDQKVVDTVANEYNFKYGARSIRDEFERLVINAVDLTFDNKAIKKGDSFKITVDEDSPPKIKVQLEDEFRLSQLSFDLSPNERLINDSI